MAFRDHAQGQCVAGGREPLGQSLGASTHWVLAALLTLIMPGILAAVAPQLIFAVFAGMMVLQLLFVIFIMVETRGRSLEDVSADLRD